MKKLRRRTGCSWRSKRSRKCCRESRKWSRRKSYRIYNRGHSWGNCNKRKWYYSRRSRNKEITTEENNVVEKTEVEEAVQEIPEENVEPVEVEETEEVAVEEQPTEEENQREFFAKIKAGLSKTRK